MDVTEALDREVIVERAEAVRFWLLGFSLSSRATGAIQRELRAIIDNDPGSYINGQRPLAGLTIADFISELHSPNSGAVGRVKSVGDAVLKELQAAIPATTKAPKTTRKAAKAVDAKPRRRQGVPAEPAANGIAPTNGTTPAVAATNPAPEVVTEAAQAEASQAAAPKRRPGRPKGSGKAAQKLAQEAPAPAQELIEAPTATTTMAAPQVAAPKAAEPQAAAPEAAAPEAVAPKRRPGRPRRAAPLMNNVDIIDTPGLNDIIARTSIAQPGKPEPLSVPGGVNQAAPKEADPALDQLIRLWSSLHPHARRAVVLYASDLLIEG